MKLLLSVLLILSIISCKPKEDDDDDLVVSNTLIGNWDFCNQSNTASDKNELIYTEQEMTFTRSEYHSLGCTGSLQITEKTLYTYKKIENNSKIEAVIKGHTITLHTDAEVTSFNTNSYCGHTAWAKDVELS